MAGILVCGLANVDPALLSVCNVPNAECNETIANHYGANLSETNWFMASLPLATSTYMLSSGRLGDILGLREY